MWVSITQLTNVSFVLIRFVICYFPQDECQVALSDNGDGVFLIGTILFNSATVIFDRENNQIGFKPF